MTANTGFLPTCNPNVKPLAASRSNLFTPRRAVDSSGQVGWLYDACNDRVLSDSNINFVEKRANPKKRPQCFFYQPDVNESYNLLKQINIHEELRLNVALQLTEPNGIGALINYTGQIDKYTRFLSYTHYSKTEYLPDNVFNSFNKIQSPRPDAQATHMIVLVNWGIDAVAVLQLPPDDEQIEEIEYVLQKICKILSNEFKALTLCENDEAFLKTIPCEEVFSNMPELAEINTILNFYSHVQSLKLSVDSHKPYNYNLYPLEHFYTKNSELQFKFIQLQQDSVFKIESYILPLLVKVRRLSENLNQECTNISQHLKNEYQNMLTGWEDLKKTYNNEINRIRKLVSAFRWSGIDENALLRDLKNTQAEKLSTMINNFTEYVNKMLKKESLIKSLSEIGFTYQNANERGIGKNYDLNILHQKLLGAASLTYVICSDDDLYTNNQTQWCRHRDELLTQRKGNAQIQLIYVDFSYCAHKLNDFIRLPSKAVDQTVRGPETKKKLTLQNPTFDESINILLLGESGVGKSTFINAFVNYLKSDGLKKAENNIIVLIPVSFMITVDDNFTEKVINYDGQDSSNNEDHDHIGQSVTQHCKSYVFTLKDGESREKKLRIIDTPGIGDTQGLNQDDQNMQHVLSYINNLTHLNAVCILLKPNNSRLTVFFRSCFTQLIDMLGEKICARIIFCFTNSRSTFYTPGNTGPLLKALIESLPVKGIGFTRKNTFCFDSESFRYLVAKLRGISFSSTDEVDYNGSWEKSSAESNRLIGYIENNMSEPIILNDSHSVKHAQLMINLMIRPMLEAMRNTLRNMILLDAGFDEISIELSAKIIKFTAAICLKCPRDSSEVVNFWLTTDGLHIFHNKCRTCRCDPSLHFPIDYELEYKQREDSGSRSKQDMKKLIDDLCKASTEFGYFLLQSTSSTQKDPFMIGFERMIKEENDICNQKTSYKLNSNLTEQLKQLKNNYERAKKKLAMNKMKIQLDDIYRIIKNVNEHRIIDIQMNAIRQWRKFMIKYYEFEVST